MKIKNEEIGRIKEQFDSMIENQRSLVKSFQEQSQKLFKTVAKDFFDHNPGITAIKWTQYTPYFNDGETCEFRVNSPTFTNATLDELENVSYGEYDGEVEGVWATEYSISRILSSDSSYDKETADLIRKCGGVDAEYCDLFTEMLGCSEMENVFLAMFGDHVQVILTREGFQVDGYDHE